MKNRFSSRGEHDSARKTALLIVAVAKVIPSAFESDRRHLRDDIAEVSLQQRVMVFLTFDSTVAP